MGIQGLIPFLEKSSKRVNIAQYSGCTVAIDAYCWLHKGAFSCADKLARGDKTNAYVVYCMKFVNMMLAHNIKPILVFDGRHLPAKADTEKKRRQNREVNKRRAAELLRMDKPSEARSYLQRCVDVTHAMALDLMRECRARNVDCITAPYEADAQLAYLNIHNIAHIVITEDSDLLLFGCTKVLFKLDLAGNGLLVEQSVLHRSMGVPPALFSMDKFRHMCILSGCDYLPSLPNIGLVKACRFVRSTVDPDIHRALSRLGGHLNMNLQVPMEYRNNFIAADAMFQHQPVFDPLRRKLVALTPVPSGAPTPPLLTEEPLSPEQLLQLALGNLDPFTLKQVDDWSPDRQCSGGRTNSWKEKSLAPHVSIWSPEFKPRAMVTAEPVPVEIPSTRGKVIERRFDLPKPPVPERPVHSVEAEMEAIRLQFARTQPPPAKKARCDDGDILDALEELESTPPPKPKAENTSVPSESPKKVRMNPFTKTPIGKFSFRSKLDSFRATGALVQSRYFGNQEAKETVVSKHFCSSKNIEISLKDVSNVMENKSMSDVADAVESESSQSPEINSESTDSGISSFVENLEPDNKETMVAREKENQSRDQAKHKREGNFNWNHKPSLSDFFGYKGQFMTPPSAVNPFINPSKSITEISECKESQTHDTSLPVECEVKIARRNPFAKVAKKEDLSVSLDSQGFSLGSDSQSDLLTPETETDSSQEFSLSSGTVKKSFGAKSQMKPACSTPKPQMKLGLSKKQSGGCQRSLTSMFSYKPKPKMQL